VQYRDFGKTGLKVSALGFGAMRLPEDDDYALECIVKSFELGVNYVDTAHGYGAGRSERIVGRALQGRRDKIILSTKNPLKDNTAAGWRQRMEESLERLQTDYLDLYMVVHSISWKAWEENFSQPGGGFQEALKAKEEGLFRHMCFSSHDTPENIIRLLELGHFEAIIIQYNLLDRSNEPVIDYCREHNIGVAIMGPVGGGRLAPPSGPIQKMLPGGAASTPEVALRFVLSNPGVSTALSGMNSVEMVEENCRVAAMEQPLSDAERAQVLRALEEVKKLSELYCTGCGYCMPCPNDVNIPLNFTFMNLHRVWGLTEHAKRQYKQFFAEPGKKRIEGLAASECQECGECEPKCPQNIPIIEQLAETAAALGD